MAAIVTACGVLIVAFGIAGLINTHLSVRVASFWASRQRLYLNVVVRLLLGALLIVAAPDTRLPLLIRLIGYISILSGCLIPFIGFDRLVGFVRWWASRPPAFLRAWSFWALLFGGLLIYAGV